MNVRETLLTLFLICGTAVSANAVTRIVNSTGDVDDNICNAISCTLRQAINVSGNGDTIEFASPLFDTPRVITLTQDELKVFGGQNIVINGRGATLTYISGNNQFRLFNNEGLLTLNGLTLTNGVSSSNGGALLNSKNMSVNYCAIEFNHTGQLGSAIFNASDNGDVINPKNLSIANTTISGNVANNTSAQQGAIYVDNGGIVTIENSTISGNIAPSNAGAGLFLGPRSTARIYSSTITANGHATVGGGVYAWEVFGFRAYLEMHNTIVSGNLATGDSQVHPTNFAINGINDHNFIAGDARLQPLAFNGGMTQTHMPFEDSPVHDAGVNTALTVDQRGPGYIRTIGPAVDIGSVELPPVVTNANTSGVGSLRQAIAEAAADSSIKFDPTFFASPRSISVTGGELSISKNLTIYGPGTDLLTLDASNANRIFDIQLNNTLSVSNLTMVNGNAGGANGGCVYTFGVFNLTNGVVANCSASSGGAIFGDTSGTVNLVNSTVRNSSAASLGGGLLTNGQLIVNVSVISNNSATAGGGIYNLGTATFTGSTVNNNTSQIGGGVFNDGTSILYGSTISGNRSTSNKGGGIYNAAGRLIHLLNATVTNNRSDSFAGAGIWNDNFTGNSPISLRSRNVIVSGNISGNGNPVDYVGDFTDLGNNIVNNPNPGLAPLANYGGATPAHALLGNSPALNTGDSCVLTANTCGILHPAFATDQRGGAAPRKIGSNVDIGAFERNITFDQANLLNGNVNAFYSQQISATRQTSLAEGGSLISHSNFAPGTFTIVPVSGQSLPPGVSLSPGGTLSGTPTGTGTFTFTVKATDADGMAGAAQYTVTMFAPTAANVSISGRVLTADGRGLRNALVSLTSQNGNTITARTSSLGYYRLDDIAAGQSYVIHVNSKLYQFTPRIITVAEDLTDIDLVANE